MKFITKTALILFILIITNGLAYSQTEGKKVGEVNKVDKKAGEVIVSSSTAAKDIRMGDLLYVRIDGKVVQIRATFPMQTIATCKVEGINRELLKKAEKGMAVYRWKKGVDEVADTQSKTYNIGKRGPGGGFVFYDKGNSDGGWRYLEAAPEDQSAKAEWGCYKRSMPGVQGNTIGDGKKNTLDLVENCDEAGTAAKLCTAYRGGGKSDWFLPSKDELDLMYKKLYKIGVGGFAAVSYSESYWSSSEDNALYAWGRCFYSGMEFFFVKSDTNYVRAIRAFDD